MQSSLVTLTCGSHVLFYTPAYVIRGMVNSMDITLLDDAGTALDITDVSTWDLGITEDFFGKTGVLAGSSTITAAENVLAVTMNGHTEELASLMDGKKSIQAYATLRGRDASDVINRLYVFPVVILNIGFTNDTILTTAAQELTYTKAQIDTKFPTVKAVKDFAQNETLTELTGADVTIAPWTQSKWSASGNCSLTASGWAESGHQVAYVLITLAAEATLAVSGATVADDDALSAAGTYACYLINENGTVYFRVANFTEAA